VEFIAIAIHIRTTGVWRLRPQPGVSPLHPVLTQVATATRAVKGTVDIGLLKFLPALEKIKFLEIHMNVEFRECDFFDLWIWLEFGSVPSLMEQQYVEEVFDSWFFLGKLGAFNAENLQVQDTGLDISYLNYDNDSADSSLVSLMHNMGDVEFEGTWARCWFDLGTTDAIALDLLINAFKELSKDYVSIQRLVIGGENEDWKVPGTRQAQFADNN
jgi:Protein of unknown function (DUF3531)